MAGILTGSKLKEIDLRPNKHQTYGSAQGRMRGFSLLEIIIALGILGAVLLPFLNFVSNRIARERQSDELIQAVEIARSKMEEMLLLPNVRDTEEIVEEKFLLKIKVYNGDLLDEPGDLSLVEIHISVLQLRNNTKLVEFRALK